MLLLRKLLPAILLTCIVVPSFAQLQVLNSSNAQALAQKLVGNGVTISNATITGANISSGFFKHLGGTQLNLDSGIVLSTGRAQTTTTFGLNGNATAEASTTLGTAGDPMLTALVSPLTTNDAIVLEFDFIPLGDSIKFRYVFSSEEYPTYACSNFNDVFAFFISGPGITGSKNIALIPGTNIPVTINSINNGNPPNGQLSVCQAMGPGSPFVQYFVDNSTNNYFTHNGHTTVLEAKSAVVPCQTYHLRLAIADVGDFILDSGVFLEAGSLTSDPVEIVTSLPLLNGLPYVVEGCQPGAIEILRAKKKTTPENVNLVFGGTAINGTDLQLVPSVVTIPANDSVVLLPITPIVDNMPEGTEVFKIYVSSACSAPGMNYLDSIIIQVRDYDTLTVSPKDTVVCKNQTMQLNAAGNFTSIQWSPAAGLSSATIANPVATAQSTTTYVATALIGSCEAKDSAILRVKSLQLLSSTNIFCKDGTNGQIKVSGGSAWKAPVQYNINNQAYGTDSTFSNLPVGNYTVRVKDATGCIDSVQVTLVQAFPDLVLSDSIITASCNGTNGQVFLTASGGKLPYTFTYDLNPYSANSNFTVNGGNHTVFVKDSNGCISSKPVVVGVDPALNFTITPSPLLCDGPSSGYIYIAATGGNGQFEYSIDGTNFQLADSFLVSTSSVTVTVRDTKGCTASNSINVPVNTPVFVNAGIDTTICEGQTLQFNTTYNATSFTWDSNPTLSATNIPNPVAAPVVTTTYYVTVTKDMCTARDTITVAVLPAPVANAGPDSTICFGRTINLNGSGGTTFNWLPSGTAGVANPVIKPTQTTTYYLQVQDANGCTSLKYDTVVITVTPPIQVFAGVDTFAAIGQPLQLEGVDLGNSGASIYTWSPSLGLNDPTILNPVATLNSDMTYTLTISTPEGCIGSDQVTVKVFDFPEIYVPTGFTPNGDGKNDILRAIPVGMKKFNYFKVFNRWGQVVFTTNNEKNGWDGKISGIKQSTGTYVWIAEAVDYKGNKIFRKGVTTLIR